MSVGECFNGFHVMGVFGYVSLVNDQAGLLKHDCDMYFSVTKCLLSLAIKMRQS